MIESLKVNKGRLTAPGGTYRALVVPACKYMPETTLQQLAGLAERGVPLIFEEALPGDVPAWRSWKNAVRSWPPRPARLEKSGAIVTGDAAAGLLQAGVPRETMADVGLRFIRRKVGQSHWYFVANHTAKAVEGWMTLSVPFVSATLFDPMTGDSGRLALAPRRRRSTGLPAIGGRRDDHLAR